MDQLPGVIASRLLPDGEHARLLRVRLSDAGHGYDVFGAHPQWIAMGAGILRPLYDRWFRVDSIGAERLPRSGPAILASNHSGVLPFDAAMIWADVLKRTDPPRLVRPILDHFVPAMRFVGTLFTRAGSVGGSRGNAERLLDAGEMLLVFPEGTTGIGKRFADRYRLQAWRKGHAELAIRHGAPVIPVAVIGAEEQMPQLGRWTRGAKLFGAPYLPIVAWPLPLPVRYHIYYGAPIDLSERYPREAADDPTAQALAAEEVRRAVESLIEDGLAARKGVFQ
jgi:1-acyl-sn-glycerol-3-phosphate acyltransferase